MNTTAKESKTAELTWSLDGIDELELYIGGYYLTNVKIADLSKEARYELGFDD